VILDLSDRSVLDQDDIDFLLDSAAYVAGRDLQLLVAAGSRSNCALLEVARVSSVLPVFLSVAEALAESREPSRPQNSLSLASDSIRTQECIHDSHRA
jgi:hypothetical protein